MIKSYRGLLPDAGQDTIPLHTNDGKTGYKVVKLQIIDNIPGNAPGAVDPEFVCKIYKVKQTAVDGVIDFNDGTLLGAAYYQGGNISTETPTSTIIFDNEIFNQDIYVTMNEGAGGATTCNYYIELEQVKLTEDQALIAIVKNLRNEQ